MGMFERIKDNVTMVDLLESYGIHPQPGHRKLYKCPFHNDTKPSAGIIGDKFHCFTENKNWDVVDFVQEYENCDKRTAISILDQRFHIGLHRKFTQAEKKEFAKRQKERELKEKRKKALKSFEKETLNIIINQYRFWENLEYRAVKTLSLFKQGNSPFDKMLFLAKKKEEWLLWLYDKICGFNHKECEYDYIYDLDKINLLRQIKLGNIKISRKFDL